MFVVRAHTFILQARLAISLAWVAGYTNIIALIVCGYVVSHVTGHASVLGASVVNKLLAACQCPSEPRKQVCHKAVQHCRVHPNC